MKRNEILLLVIALFCTAIVWVFFEIWQTYNRPVLDSKIEVPPVRVQQIDTSIFDVLKSRN